MSLYLPIRIKDLEIKNRIVMPPMVCFNWSDQSGILSDDHLKHYQERAGGGTGLIILEALAVDKHGRLDSTQCGIWSDNHIDRLKEVADRCHLKFPYNWIVYLGTEIKKDVEIPTIVVNGIRKPEQAEYLIDNELADMVAIGRGLLVDPEWAQKAKKGLPVKPCLECNKCQWFDNGYKCPGRYS